MWIIVQAATGKYVAKPGSKESFTRNIQARRQVRYFRKRQRLTAAVMNGA